MVNQVTIFPMENSKDERVCIGISAGNWKQRSTIIDTFFLTLSSGTKLPYWGGFGIWVDRCLTPKIKWTRFFSLGKATGIGEGKVWIKTC